MGATLRARAHAREQANKPQYDWSTAHVPLRRPGYLAVLRTSPQPREYKFYLGTQLDESVELCDKHRAEPGGQPHKYDAEWRRRQRLFREKGGETQAVLAEQKAAAEELKAKRLAAVIGDPTSTEDDIEAAATAPAIPAMASPSDPEPVVAPKAAVVDTPHDQLIDAVGGTVKAFEKAVDRLLPDLTTEDLSEAEMIERKGGHPRRGIVGALDSARRTLSARG